MELVSRRTRGKRGLEAHHPHRRAALVFRRRHTFDQDDAEAWAAVSRGIRGPIGRSLNLNFQATLGWRDEHWDDFPGPGRTCMNMFTEQTEFDFLVEWRRRMEAA